jgi:hypothetical protein
MSRAPVAALAAFTVMAGLAVPVQAQEPHVYRAAFLQAAPGRLRELVAAVRDHQGSYDRAGLPRPLVGRHTQGDRWDLLIVEPVGSVAAWADSDRRKRLATAALEQRIEPLVAWQEELLVTGPPLAEFQRRNEAAGFYHLEIFQGLAGKRDSLFRERLMEDDFSRRIGRPDNLVFVRLAGASWDMFTVGFYRDLAHYAVPSGLTVEQEEAAAQAAGFAARDDIGPYLRRFIALHHDTLLNRVR